MSNYVISWHDSVNHGGSKAKSDVEFFLNKQGFNSIDTPEGKISKVLFVYFKFPKLIRSLNNSIIVFQFPSGKPFLRKHMLDVIRRSTNKLVILIHDIETLRLNSSGNHKVANSEELNELSNCDYLISHNKVMTAWLKKQGVKTPIVNLNIFDYDNPQSVITRKQYQGSVCFAGNLAKSSFLNKLQLKHRTYLYGINPSSDYHSNVVYKGLYDPNELPKHLTYDFGLVWDGPDVESCNGNYGQYMKYNNPHKVSLYLSTGLPVIIWSKAAMASFVQKNGLGITIDNLNDLDQRLDAITQSQYDDMVRNVKAESQKLRNGYYIDRVMDKVVSSLTGEKHE